MLQVRNISFSYSPDSEVLKNVSFSLDKGAHLCVMGASGCGKSTLLKLVYGLLDARSGSMQWNERQIRGPAYHLIPGMPFFKYVAQDYDLMPFTSVADNVSKFLPRTEPRKSERRTMELLELIQMTEFAEKQVKLLSGGQKQRVAIARALALEPELLLLDEPFSQVDHHRRNALRRMLFAYLKEKNIACMVATHDAEDALSYADKLIVLKDRVISAEGSPSDLFNSPPGKYVASLFDDVNELVIHGKTELLYPHQIRIVADSALRATVECTYFQGSRWLVAARLDGHLLYLTHHCDLEKDQKIFLHLDSTL